MTFICNLCHVHVNDYEIEIGNSWFRTIHSYRKCKKYVNPVKYVCKGSDKAAFALTRENQHKKIDTALFFKFSNETIWRILSFPIDDRKPDAVHLTVHLENKKTCVYNLENGRNSCGGTNNRNNFGCLFRPIPRLPTQDFTLHECAVTI